ncbi:hypothetical protein VKT23_010761 [Stygiomarasmius scandens]|uniref:FHA domain-containing protein n=1 Tax=Marasmiellus scandens TaxID=2682957 RepID=A0ABR1JFR4_9AGAR
MTPKIPTQDTGIRLCYPDVDQLHCKITFEEKKAFLVVLGATGLTVDGCRVYPNLSSSSPTTVPLTNNTEFEIHGKRFKFTYPPKELRAQLYASPVKPRSRALRMSMINSAQVFSPRPSPNPLENLRVLKSSLKPFKNAAPSPSPIRKSISPQSDLEDEEVVLVEGNCPRVVEEDKDLAILEHVEIPSARSRPPSPTKTYGHIQAPPSTQLLQLQAQQLSRPPKTPTRPSPSLHKAVLMRSAQKVVLSADVVEEEMEEEMEVLGALAEDEGDEGEKGNFKVLRRRTRLARANKGKDVRPGGKPKEKEDATMDADVSDTPNAPPIHEETHDEADENPAPLENSLYPPIPRFQIPAAPSAPRHNLPSSSSPGRMFMTPQPQPSQVGNRFSLAPRVSLGGDGPRRIKIEDQVWKVQDLMAQPDRPPTILSPVCLLKHRLRARHCQTRNGMRLGRGDARPSPVKASTSPSKSNGFGPEDSVEKEDDDLDTRSLLARMRETVENMKDAKERRASLALASPKKSVVSFEAVTSASTPGDAEVETDSQNGSEPAFSLLRIPSTKLKSSAPRR